MIKLGQNNISAMYLGDTEVSKIYLGETQVYPNSQPQPTLDYLTFTAQQANSTIKYTPSTVSTASYSTDGTNWNSFDNQTVSLNSGDSIYVKGVISDVQSSSDYAHFTMTGKIAASGSIMSLQNENPNDTAITYTGAFRYMFYNCKSLTQAPKLPATTLANYCYQSMFSSCNSLTTATELPATTLANYCYQYMFQKCTSLTAAIELPATTLANGCYNSMFNGCSSLTVAPELPATTLAFYCYQNMFQDCTSLTTAPELPATTLANGCYSYMFYKCTSLTTAPELPATTLAATCYSNMFYGCSSLTSVTHHITNWNTSNTNSWLSGVASTGTVICPAASTISSNDVSGIPTGWVRQDI